MIICLFNINCFNIVSDFYIFRDLKILNDDVNIVRYKINIIF